MQAWSSVIRTAYACTFLHECGHATGHPSRLNRDMSGGFGSESYAREELRAEIASAFTAQAIGLHLTDEQLQPHMELHKAYIQSWASALQDAPGELFRAIKDAEKISDYLIEKGEFENVLGLNKTMEATPVKEVRQEKGTMIMTNKESFDKLFAGIEKERSSRQAVAPARTIMPQRER